jgi:predicted Zn finger-like uncharacterized protein
MQMVIVVGGSLMIALLLFGVVLTFRNHRPMEGPRYVPVPPPAAPRVEPPKPNASNLTCPACRTRFRPPDVMVTTHAMARKYGPDPVQCPNCNHIWNAGRNIKTIRG